MTDDRQNKDASPTDAASEDVPDVAVEDESLDAASKETVEYMEKSDEPGHAGRGDYG
jgi:hypothetical protein